MFKVSKQNIELYFFSLANKLFEIKKLRGEYFILRYDKLWNSNFKKTVRIKYFGKFFFNYKYAPLFYNM